MKGRNLLATLIVLSFSSQAWADEQKPIGPQHGAASSANKSRTILAKWAQLIPASDGSSTPTISVRVVLNGADTSCGGIITRSSYERKLITTERPNSDPDHFDVKVCETLFGWKTGTVTFLDDSSLSWSTQVNSVALLGDTGCRSPEKDQDCKSAWLFEDIAQAIAARKPSLLIHVGDYRYKGNGTDRPDTWQNWDHDFFTPAQALLAKVPLVMARGNHDNCYKKENKGAGWLLLLSPYRWQTGCRDNKQKRETPYALDVGLDLRLVVMDTANAVAIRKEWEDSAFRRWEANAFDKYLDHLSTLIRPDDGRAVWLVTHYPVINIEEDERKSHVLREKILPILTAAGSKVEAVLSGDIHQLQVLGMVKTNDASVLAKPVQFVVGNGGAAPAEGFGPPMKPPGWFKRSEENVEKLGLENEWYDDTRCRTDEEDEYYFKRLFETGVARGHGSCRHGFATLLREGNTWQFMPVFVSNEGEDTKSDNFGCRLVEGDHDSCYFISNPSKEQIVHRSEAMLYNVPASSIIGNYAYSVQAIKGSDKLLRVELGTISDVMVRIGAGGDKQFYAVVENGSWRMEVDLGALYLDDQGYIVLDKKISNLPADAAAIEILAPPSPAE
jgi:Calcineurin-like phosphoesterase